MPIPMESRVLMNTAGTNPNQDDYPPVLMVPDDIEVVSTGPLTEVDLGEATASDARDGVIVLSVDISGPFLQDLTRLFGPYQIDQAILLRPSKGRCHSLISLEGV